MVFVEWITFFYLYTNLPSPDITKKCGYCSGKRYETTLGANVITNINTHRYSRYCNIIDMWGLTVEQRQGFYRYEYELNRMLVMLKLYCNTSQSFRNSNSILCCRMKTWRWKRLLLVCLRMKSTIFIAICSERIRYCISPANCKVMKNFNNIEDIPRPQQVRLMVAE